MILRVILSVYYWFSQYTDSTERRVGRFLSRQKENSSFSSLEQPLTQLLQRHIAVINLWTEREYKGYRYLTKSKRRELYRNLNSIHSDFEVFCTQQTIDIDQALSHITKLGVSDRTIRQHEQQLIHMLYIMRYLSPRSGRYIYRESSSFGRLLGDPMKETLVGDCNQIVTLYISLYAAKYDITDLKLTLYPGHVALHFFGVDVEATSGTFAHYDNPEQTIVPVQEIISVNLLDTTDVNFKRIIVNPQTFLQAARLAYILSSHRALVTKNLAAAYGNTVSYLLKQHNDKLALEFAKQSKDMELIEIAANNGSVNAMKNHQFRSARRFASHSMKKKQILRTIDSYEGAHLYKAKKYAAAVRIFEKIGERDNVKACYESLYFDQQALLKHIKTAADVRAHAKIVRSMQHYARKSGNTKLIAHAADLAKHL